MINLLSISDWIAITGLLITIILYQRVRRKKIIFLTKNHYQLNNVNFSRYENIKMVFNDEEIDNYLFYISGTMILSGDSDVDRNDINHSPCIIIKDINGSWKSYSILKKTDLLQCNLIVQNNTLKIETEELKSKDYITISAFYHAQKPGIKFRHRILNVNNNVEVIAEDSTTGNLVSAILLTIGICLFSYFLIDINTEEKYIPIIEKIKYTQKVNLKKPTKEDSIIGKRYQYDELYYIHGDSLKFDSVFKKNSILNERRNKMSHIRVTKVIDSIYANKTDYISKLEEFRLRRKFLKDSIYYVDDKFLYNTVDSILLHEITKVKKINSNKRYKINDSISVSFILRDYYNKDKKQEKKALFSSQNIASFILSVIIIFFIFLDFHVIYHLYLLNKYKKYVDYE